MVEPHETAAARAALLPEDDWVRRRVVLRLDEVVMHHDVLIVLVRN